MKSSERNRAKALDAKRIAKALGDGVHVWTRARMHREIRDLEYKLGAIRKIFAMTESAHKPKRKRT
jgi:hypothetical protein